MLSIWGIEYPLSQFGSSVPIVSPLTFLCIPSLTAGVELEAEKVLLVQAALVKISLYYQQWLLHKS